MWIDHGPVVVHAVILITEIGQAIFRDGIGVSLIENTVDKDIGMSVDIGGEESRFIGDRFYRHTAINRNGAFIGVPLVSLGQSPLVV